MTELIEISAQGPDSGLLEIESQNDTESSKWERFKTALVKAPETLEPKWKELKEKIRKFFTPTAILGCIVLLALLTPLCYYGWQETTQYLTANTHLNRTGYEPRFMEFDENDRTPLTCEHNLTIGPVL